MTPRRDDPRHTFDRELRRAEKERRSTVTALAVGLMALALVVAGIVTLTAGGRAAPQNAAGTGAAGETAGSATEVDATAAGESGGGAEVEPEPEPAAPEPAASEPEPAPEPAPKPAPKPAGPQKLSVGLGQYGYEPSTLTAKAGVPIELTVAQGQGCAAGFLIPGLGISADNTQGPAKVKLPALEAGTYRFYCGMQMVEGALVVR